MAPHNACHFFENRLYDWEDLRLTRGIGLDPFRFNGVDLEMTRNYQIRMDAASGFICRINHLTTFKDTDPGGAATDIHHGAIGNVKHPCGSGWFLHES